MRFYVGFMKHKKRPETTAHKSVRALQQTMTKRDLVSLISQERGIHPNDVRNIVQAFLDTMIDVLSRGVRIEFRDFGVFDVVERRSRIGRNPKKANVTFKIPSKTVVKFTPGKKMRVVIEAEAPKAISSEE